MIETNTQVAVSKSNVAQYSFGHLDFGHLILFRISDFEIRTFLFNSAVPPALLWGVISKPGPLGPDLYFFSMYMPRRHGQIEEIYIGHHQEKGEDDHRDQGMKCRSGTPITHHSNSVSGV